MSKLLELRIAEAAREREAEVVPEKVVGRAEPRKCKALGHPSCVAPRAEMAA
jgi:hypothetical protein